MNKILLGTLFLSALNLAVASSSDINQINSFYLNKAKQLRDDQPMQTPLSNIQPGMGYASDIQFLAPIACYAPTEVSHNAQGSSINLTSNMTIDQLSNTFGISAFLHTGYGQFSIDSMSQYFHSMEDDDYSLSLNYYEIISGNAHMTYSYIPATLLSDAGKSIYANGTNPMFRILCGERLVTDYSEGAGLIMSVKINFNSKLDKQTFTENVSTNFGNFINASVQISQAASKYHVNGTISVTGIQFGGQPQRLSKMLSESTPLCDINNVSKCQDVAAKIVDYAANDFPNQFQSDGDRIVVGLVPLGSYSSSFSIKDLGMALPDTYITPEIQQMRDNLMKQKNNTQTYVNGLSTLLADGVYPVSLDQSFRGQLQSALITAQNNMQTINGGNLLRCWSEPNNCLDVGNTVISKLLPVNMPSNFDTVFAGIRVAADGGWYSSFWPDGAGDCKNGYYDCNINFKEYTPNNKQTGFFIRNASNAVATTSTQAPTSNDGFTATGIYHDGGSCPFDAQYTISNKNITYFTVNPGGCANPQRYVTMPYALDVMPNPFYFTISN